MRALNLPGSIATIDGDLPASSDYSGATMVKILFWANIVPALHQTNSTHLAGASDIQLIAQLQVDDPVKRALLSWRA